MCPEQKFIGMWRRLLFLTKCVSLQGRSGIHLTHVMFSPNGEEVLLSYSGEHVYLMDSYRGMERTPLKRILVGHL